MLTLALLEFLARAAVFQKRRILPPDVPLQSFAITTTIGDRRSLKGAVDAGALPQGEN